MIALELSFIEPLGRVTARPWASEVTGVKIDSRLVDEGDLFVAVGGGADFVAHALARGAAAALVPEDAHAALAAIAGEVRNRATARVVGITGATGKTTTKDILAALCSPHQRTIANEGSLNNELDVPLHTHLAETSAVLRINPDLVDLDAANAEFPPFPDYTVPTGAVHTAFFFSNPGSVHWATKSGTWGDARQSTPETGERFIQAGVRSTVALMENIEKTFSAMPVRD